MLIEFQPPAVCRVANHQTGLSRATAVLALNACIQAVLALNACRDGASTASLGNLFILRDDVFLPHLIRSKMGTLVANDCLVSYPSS